MTAATKTSACVVLTTAASEAEAEAIADAIIEAQLAACVSLFPMKSVYTWQGKVERESEWQLIIKTQRHCFEALREKIQAVHSYDTPELIALPIVAGSPDYLAWLGAQVMPE